MSNIWHIITPEYPPSTGGVSGYSAQVAEGLRSAHDEVHIWCPGPSVLGDPTWVHRQQNWMTLSNLRQLSKELNRFPMPRRLLVQWLPHGYGWSSMNLFFCLWLWKRALCGDRVEIMLHEAFLSFKNGNWRHIAAATVHRFMTVILLRAASYVWMSTPAWERMWRPYSFGKKVPFTWLPIPSNIPVNADIEATRQIKQRYTAGGKILLGHFGTYGKPIVRMLEEILPKLLNADANRIMLLIGKGSREFRASLIGAYPALAGRLIATGLLDSTELSDHLAACDLLLQPYPDGINARRTTVLAALAHGVPLITTIGHMTEDIWHRGQGLILVPSTDCSDYIRGAEEILADPAALLELHSGCTMFYEAQFRSGRMIATLQSTAS